MSKTPHRYFGVVLPVAVILAFYDRQLTNAGASTAPVAQPVLDLFPTLSPALLDVPLDVAAVAEEARAALTAAPC